MELERWRQIEKQITAVFDAQHPFGVGTVRLEPSGIEFAVAVASTPGQKIRGMRGRQFDGFDALLFVEDTDSLAEFHMAGVDAPLGLVLFDRDGVTVGAELMPPESTFRHRPNRPYRWALEVPAATFSSVDWQTQTLTVDDSGAQ